MTVPAPAPPERGGRLNLVAGIVVLGLLVVGTVLGLWALRNATRPKEVSHSVYFPGLPHVGARTEVLFQGAHVGEVVGTDPPQFALQLRVTATLAPELTQVLTLLPGQTVRLVGPSDSGVLRIALQSLTASTIGHARGTYVLRRTGADGWLLDQSGSRERLVVNGRKQKANRLTLHTGDLLEISALLVEWQDVAEYSQVRLHLDLGKVRKTAGLPDSTSETFLLGPRSSIGIASAFGLGKPALRLEPGLGRKALAVATGTVIAPSPSVDLERSVQGMLVYLNSPAALHRAPANRFERVVSDLNDGLAQVAEVGTRLQTILKLADDVSRQQGGVGMIGRLVLPPATLESLDATAARVAAGTVLFSDTSRSVLARLKLDTLETAVTRAVVSADQTLKRVGGSLDSLNFVISTVRDSLPRILGRTNKFLAQGTGTVKGVQGWIPPVAIAGMALSLAGILKLIGVF